jgi:hypothetical protein
MDGGIAIMTLHSSYPFMNPTTQLPLLTPLVRYVE